jgi:hypothetical protein
MRAPTLIAACLCILLAGCDRKTTDKSKVFNQYFHAPAPTNSNIIKASNWEAYGVGLDEWELVLEAELPRDFLDAALPLTPTATPPNPSSAESLFGDADATRGVAEALKDHPSWFTPTDASQFSIITNQTRLSFVSGFAAVTFTDPVITNHFQLWISDHGWSRLFIDRQTGRIYAHHKFP